MEYLTNSSGLSMVMNQCSHNIAFQPIQPSFYNIRSNSALPTLSNSFNVTRSTNKALNYGSTILLPNDSFTKTLRSSSVASGPIMSSKRRIGVPHYDSINDPHLRDYFERKFSLSSANKKKLKIRKPGPNECIYRIKVRTGNVNNASTTANVHLTICGQRFNMPRKHLFNKYEAILTENGYKFKFERNSTNVFKLIGVDVGQISHIIIEHDGKEMLSSWYLQDVLITNTKSHRSWLFECNDWLSLDHGLGKTKIHIAPTRQLDKYTQTDYEIVTITGDKLGAGTDAQVFITLFGPRNKCTQKIELKNNDKNLFEKGKTDVFKLTNINYVGPIQKIRIEHDNSGRAPGWFLERVVVTDLKDPKVKYFCPCSKWLAKDEDDGQISRDLLAVDDLLKIQKIGKYRITVFTGKQRGAGTDADVTIVLYGNLGDSGEWKLDDEKNNFERGKKDEFEIECPSVGELNKIRIGHNNKGAAPGWFLNKVIVDDLEKHRVYEFTCNRWLAEDEDDGKTNIFLHSNSNSNAQEHYKGVPYTIIVHTGDVRNAGTSAKVFVELFGGKSGNTSSGRIILSDGEFKQGKIDKLIIDSPEMLSPLSEILIGHDNSGIGPGWFLDKVEVVCNSIGMKQVFPCNKWLAKDESDGRIERYLKENTSLREQHKSESVWFVWVYTSDLKNAGTDANVSLMIYGDKGKTDQISLRNKSDNFEAGKCDKFKIETKEIGQPFKLRVQHDNKGLASGWHLDRIEIENMETKQRFYFVCNRWLSVDEDDKQIIRELPAENDQLIRKPLPIVNYIVEVQTGSKASAGTNANVFINIFGELGDTGERFLEKSETNRDKFERNKLDVFRIEAVTLKKIKKIRIGHDGKGVGDGWFLKGVTVKQENSSKYDQIFECNRWLATDEDDGQIVRELLAEGGSTQYLDKTTYNIKVKTGDISNAGTDANVHLKIFGEKGDSGILRLEHSDTTSNKFERGRTDSFKIESEDIGKIDKIKIGHNGKGLGSGWFLDYAEIEVPSKGQRYLFSAHRWLDEGEEDGQIEIELRPTEVKKTRKMVPYVISIKTGDKTGMGTDANVFIQIYGIDGKSEECVLKNKSDNFERGKEDIFKIETDDVGPIFKVRIGHDDSGRNSGWFLEKMHIARHANKSPKHSRRSFRDSPDLEEYFFTVNKWFARDEDDKQIVRELMPTDEKGRLLVQLDEVPYEVKVFTGNKSGAGTDSNVFLNLYGPNGDSGDRELRKSDNLNKFERNQCDTFIVKAIELGELEKIKIGHDNSAPGSAWYLEKAEIYNPNTQKTYLFNCQNWLAKNEGDGKTTRELLAIDPTILKHVKFRPGTKDLKDQFLLETEVDETKSPVKDALTTTYNVTTVTSDKKGAGTDSNVYIQLYGNKNDTGKIELVHSKTNSNKFERGNSDTFEIKTSDIGNIRKIKIGHDGKGIGSGWHLKEVIIDAPKLGKKWRLPCNRWLDKSEDDGKIERELEPLEMSSEEYTPFVPYEIDVYTSDKRGADTSANPYIVMYGEDIRTQQTNLCKNKAERRDKFKRGACDRFVLELEDVGEKIKKIRIGHDNDGIFAGWHVDRVEIRRLKKSGKGSKIFVFPCNRWLARDEDDKAIERDLVPLKSIDETIRNDEVQVKERDIRDKLEMKTYQVEVFTGDVLRAGTNANVFVTLFGEYGDSGEKKLMKSETHMDKFERKQMDRFLIQAADLGRLFKVIVRHDDSAISSDWFLDRIEVTDGRDKALFLCERWLSKSKEDKQIERTLFEKNYKGPKVTSTSSLLLKSNIGSSQFGSSHEKLSLRQQSPNSFRNQDDNGPTVTYTIIIRTGDERNQGNSGQVSIRLIGDNKRLNTGKINLQLAKKKRFEPGSAETFQIDAMDIGELRQVELGHDGFGKECNWFVKSVEVKEPLRGRSYFITCSEWLSSEQGDGRTTRKFNVDEATTKISNFSALIPYNISIYTGDVPKAGTDSNVTLKFFGSKSSSSDIFIEKIENRFDRASADNLHIELEDIGSLKKVRVSHDAKGVRKEWFLDKIEMTNMNTRKSYLFKCQEWLSKNREGSRGLAIDVALFKDGQEMISTTDYKISVKTSDLSGAGTDANVMVILFGEHGDSGELKLNKSETNMNKFERKRTDVFTFKSLLSLGELSKLRVWHDDSGSLIGHANWHLESIKVEDLSSGRSFVFNCNKWLSLSKDDKQIVRELKPEDSGDRSGTPRLGEKTVYDISVTTADERNAGTKQNVFIVLIGENGMETKPKLLENTFENKILRRGQTDEFKFKTNSVGMIKMIVLGHVSKQDDPPRTKEERNAIWTCHQVVVKDTIGGNSFVFAVNETLGLDQDPQVYKCASKKESFVNKTRALNDVSYEVTVYTGSERGSGGTNANVSITIFGKNGDTGKRPLKKSFEKDHADKFLIESLDLGALKKVYIEHDNTSFKKNWFLDKIEIKNLTTNEMTTFPCGRWLSKEKEDGEIARDLYPEDTKSRDSSRSPRGSFKDFKMDDNLSLRNKKFDDSKLDFLDRPTSRSKDWERTSSMREPPRDDNFQDRERNVMRSERDVYRERERDMYSRSPRQINRNNF